VFLLFKKILKREEKEFLRSSFVPLRTNDRWTRRVFGTGLTGVMSTKKTTTTTATNNAT